LSDIYVIDRQGAVIVQVPGGGLSITGLAWYAADPDGYKLYIFSRDGTNHARISKLNPATHNLMTVTDLPAQAGDRAAGCTITPDWNSTLVVFGGVIRNNSGARLAIHEMVFNSSWMQVVPSSGTVPGGGFQDVTVNFNPSILRDAVYHVDLHISSLVYDSTMVLPVTLIVRRPSGVKTPSHTIPTEFALHQNFPNPFNPTTIIRYELKSEDLTRLSVYNLLGEKVADLVNAKQAAGYYDVNFNASNLPSGVYFYRLTSGSFVHSAKMVLMR
jgi:hypothetical protein